jgi:hypothetical protein
MVIAQNSRDMEFLILKQVQASPAFSLDHYDYLGAMAIIAPEGIKYPDQYGKCAS